MFPTSNKPQTANNRCSLLVTHKYSNVKYDSERLCIIREKDQTLFYNDNIYFVSCHFCYEHLAMWWFRSDDFVELGDITSEARSRNIYV
jgi:hypothetical protein